MPQVDFNTFLSIITLFALLFIILLTIIAFFNLFLMNWIKKNENFFLNINKFTILSKIKKIIETENEKEFISTIK